MHCVLVTPQPSTSECTFNDRRSGPDVTLNVWVTQAQEGHPAESLPAIPLVALIPRPSKQSLGHPAIMQSESHLMSEAIHLSNVRWSSASYYSELAQTHLSEMENAIGREATLTRDGNITEEELYAVMPELHDVSDTVHAAAISDSPYILDISIESEYIHKCDRERQRGHAARTARRESSVNSSAIWSEQDLWIAAAKGAIGISCLPGDCESHFPVKWQTTPGPMKSEKFGESSRSTRRERECEGH